MCAILYFFLIVCNKPHANPTIIYENVKEKHILAIGGILEFPILSHVLLSRVNMCFINHLYSSGQIWVIFTTFTILVNNGLYLPPSQSWSNIGYIYLLHNLSHQSCQNNHQFHHTKSSYVRRDHYHTPRNLVSRDTLSHH